MTKEQKELLIKDLYARMPYGIKAEIKYYDGVYKLQAIYTDGTTYVTRDVGNPIETYFEDCKPYLIPLSSMTEEQKRDLTNLFNCTVVITEWEIVFPNYYDSNMDNWNKVFNWCYKNHFDCNDLIPLGLAIDCTNLNIY